MMLKSREVKQIPSGDMIYMARNYFVDAAKGVSIILVVANHSFLDNWFKEWIVSLSMVRMPLFFFLSGIFLKVSDKPFTFLQKKFSALLKPYLVFGLFLAVLLSLMGRGDFFTHALGIVWGTKSQFLPILVLWFLPHLFMVYCLAYVILNKVQLDYKKPLHYGVLLMLYFVGLYSLEGIEYSQIGDIRNSGLPFSIDIAVATLPIFLLGKLLRDFIINFQPRHFLFLICACIFIGATLMGGFLDFHYRVLSAPIAVFFGSLCGIYAMLYLIFYIAKVSFVERLLVLIGKQSLFILLFHALILGFAREPLKAIESDATAICLTIVSLVVAVGSSVVAGIVIRKFHFLKMFFVPSARS